MLKVGELIDGRYRVLREIGRGGTGIVYLVLHEQVGQLCAMKVMRTEEYGRMLQEELRILRSLRHSMLPEIVDVIFCSEGCCLIMRYIEGETLEQVMQQRRITLQEALCWGIRLCEVMQYLHNRPVPVFYFDLKPSNIILDINGNLCLVDFGSAISMFSGQRIGEKVPRTGTPGYAAPELYEDGAAADGRADVYSIGAVLFDLLCREKPRGGEPAAQCMEAMRRAGAADGKTAEGFARILSDCLRIEPEKRPQDCRRLQQSIWRLSGKGRLFTLLQYVGKGFHFFAAVLSVLCLCVSFLCFSASAGMRSRVYASDLQRAALAGEEEKKMLLEEAVTLFPERGEPYMDLLKVMTQDDVFSPEESAQLTGILCKCSMGRTAENISFLREDADAYIQFVYRLGLTYFFLAGKSGDRMTAAGWLAQAADPGEVSRCRDSEAAGQIRADALILLELCEYYSSDLTFSGSRIRTDPTELWGRLKRLLMAGKENASENEWIMREWLQIFYDNMDFLRQDIGDEEIRRALDEAGKRLVPMNEESAGADAQELRAFYDLILADWNVLCSARSSVGEGE